MKILSTFLYTLFIAATFSMIFTACASDAESGAPVDSGVGGSLARFTIVGNYLYAVDYTKLKVFNLDNPARLTLVGEQVIGETIETIFPFNNLLFIGSAQSSYIYRIGEKGMPEFVSEYDHSFIESCDPIVANETHAYVTLRSGGNCRVGMSNNELHILSLADINKPELLAVHPMTHPLGLGIDGNLLFLCDDADGLKFFDVSDPENIKMVYHFQELVAYDVLVLDGLLIVVGPDNLYQLDYSDLENIRILSQIPIKA